MLRRIRLALHRATLPKHPYTGFRAIGLLSNGRPVWPIAGAEDNAGGGDGGTGGTGDAGAGTGSQGGGQGGSGSSGTGGQGNSNSSGGDGGGQTGGSGSGEDDKTDWKAEARKWETRAKENHAKAQKLDEFETANATELEKATKAAEQAQEAAQAANARAVKAEVRSLADGFVDREDAVLRLGDLNRFIGDDGEIDTKAIGRELKDVLEKNKHLAKPDSDGGSGGDNNGAGAGNGQRKPVEKLRAGAAPAEGERKPVGLASAVSAHYAQQQ